MPHQSNRLVGRQPRKKTMTPKQCLWGLGNGKEAPKGLLCSLFLRLCDSASRCLYLCCRREEVLNTRGGGTNYFYTLDQSMEFVDFTQKDGDTTESTVNVLTAAIDYCLMCLSRRIAEFANGHLLEGNGAQGAPKGPLLRGVPHWLPRMDAKSHRWWEVFSHHLSYFFCVMGH